MNASKEPPNGSTATLSEQNVQDLLIETSRTFAVCIPMLPDSIRQSVGIAYLLYRVADTIEDGTVLNKPQRIQLLRDFGSVLEAAQMSKPEWIYQGVQLQGHCPTVHCQSDNGPGVERLGRSTRVYSSEPLRGHYRNLGVTEFAEVC